MKQRIIAALVALPPVLFALWQGGYWWMAIIFIVTILGGMEFFTLMQRGGYRPARWLGVVWQLALVLSFIPDLSLSPVTVLTFGLLAAFTWALYQQDRPVVNWALTVTGPVYLGLMLGQALALRLLPQGAWWMLLALAVPMLNDTFAYFVGISMGRHKIWPRLSPKKSWEGTIGGWIAAALTGGLLALYTPVGLPVWGGFLLGTAGGVLAFFGDISISMIKRQIGVKDSGRLFPGHGGMLDRLDSLLYVMPVVYQVAWLMTK